MTTRIESMHPQSANPQSQTPSTVELPPLLQVSALSLLLGDARQPVLALDDVSFSLAAGERLGIVGESGAGKTQLCHAIMGLLPAQASLRGRIVFDGDPLTRMTAHERNALRGRRMAMIFQEPQAALTPHLTIGTQIAEVLVTHRRLARVAARQRAVALLDRVGIASAASRANAYPHQLSGGQCQRAMIAMALAGSPDLLIADEPTTALDVVSQTHIIDLLVDVCRDSGMALVFVSHDLDAVAQACDRMAVLYAGRIVEEAATRQLLHAPVHPYTQALLGALPQIDVPRPLLAQIPGQPPVFSQRPPGCAFAPRCARAQASCHTQPPPLQAPSQAHAVRCHLP